VIGDGPLRAEVETAAAGARGAIEVLGMRPHDDVIARIKRAAFLVLPSEWYEAFPHVILEAFACGVPIIASRIGTLADVIRHGKNGVLFRPGDARDLAANIQWMVSHPGEAAELGMAGRAEFELEYTAQRNYHRLQEIYQNLAQTNRFAPAFDRERVLA
jgi:glycosyltransferase involved in cell wall biosynthesis